MLSWLHQIGHAFFAIFITSNKCFLFQTIDFSKTKMLMWCFFSCESINCTNRDAKNLISQLGEIHQSFLYKSLFSMYFWIKAVIKFYVSRNINCSNFSDMHNCFFSSWIRPKSFIWTVQFKSKWFNYKHVLTFPISGKMSHI